MGLTQGQGFGHWHCHSVSGHPLRTLFPWDAHPRQEEWEMRAKDAEDSGNMHETLKSTICFWKQNGQGIWTQSLVLNLAEIQIPILFRHLLRSGLLRKVK